MLIWDEADVIAYLEVVPVVGEFETSHTFTVSRDGLRLELVVHAFDGDVCISLYRDGVELPIFCVKLVACDGVRRVNDKRGEYLEFAPAKCFGGRYDGLSPIPFGFRVTVKPHISVTMFANPYSA